jgi:hypothetical protein
MAAPTWAGATTADTDLAANRLPFVSAALNTAVDTLRAPAAVDWAMDRGLQGGHVLVLYKLARNALKWSCVGKVPTSADMTTGLFLGLALLLRVAQDVQACVTDLGRPSCAWVFEAFCGKVAGWVAAWPPESLPCLSTVTAMVLEWAVRPRGTWPNPAWVGAFSQPTLMGTAFTFAEPSPADVAAFDRCRTLDSTRAEVTARLGVALEGVTVWDAAVARRLRGLVVVGTCPAAGAPPA